MDQKDKIMLAVLERINLENKIVIDDTNTLEYINKAIEKNSRVSGMFDIYYMIKDLK